MAKRVLLLNCPGDKVYLQNYYCSYTSPANYYWQPLDLVLLSGVLRDHDLKVIDAVADRLKPAEAERRILEFAPEAIVVSTGSATWAKDIAFLAPVKEKTGALVLASSSMFLFEAEHFLKASPVMDALILNVLSPEIPDFIAGVERPYHALAYRLPGGGLSIDPVRRKEQDFSIPLPRHELFNLKANRSPLARRTPFALVMGSLGCPFTCSFCVIGSVAYQYRNVANIMEELRLLKSLGVREVMFNDPTFTVSEKRVVELCRRMQDEDMGLTWVANGHVATLSDTMLAEMREAGCHLLMIGVENVRDAILEKVNKGATADEIRRAFALCRKFKVRTLAYFIIGLPGETRESALATIRFAKELGPDYASFTTLSPDIGTKVRAEAIAQGLLDPEIRALDQMSLPVFSSGDLEPEEIWKLRKKALRAFYLRPSYILRKLLGVRRPRDLWLLADQALSLFFR
ncbi:MAG: radical SAM protein [Candidatus Aminicenantes bacterium]|nr:radical SAM protein [Candidatus Aminicenantes bacterium]